VNKHEEQTGKKDNRWRTGGSLARAQRFPPHL